MSKIISTLHLPQSQRFIEKLQHILDDHQVLLQEVDKVAYLTDWRGIFHGEALAVVFPTNTNEVQKIVQLCLEYNVKIVPQGGNTNLTGSATPEPMGEQIVLSLKRMNQIRAIDLDNQTITVEAGCILQTVQEKAKEFKALFPLSLAAEGSCTIGGNLATNAGGINVLRYGNTRDLCLGIEAVTADGNLYEGLRGLRKDNTGYDLRNLLIGSEGTLGIITAAVLKLFPAPINRCAAFVAVNSDQAILKILLELQKIASNELCAFEMMSREALALTQHHFPQLQHPIFATSDYTLLIELNEFDQDVQATDIFEKILGKALESEEIQDVVISTSLSQVKQFWAIREHITLAQAKELENIKYDISFELSKIGAFIESTSTLLTSRYPDIRIINFGHFGDGNLHFNLCPPLHSEKNFLQNNANEINQLVYAQIEKFQGSISAEHGIGQLKREYLENHRGNTAYQMMQAIKHALDPQNILNPNKVIYSKL
jgi:FAD/FMN-containing dehydrogenase